MSSDKGMTIEELRKVFYDAELIMPGFSERDISLAFGMTASIIIDE